MFSGWDFILENGYLGENSNYVPRKRTHTKWERESWLGSLKELISTIISFTSIHKHRKAISSKIFIRKKKRTDKGYIKE